MKRAAFALSAALLLTACGGSAPKPAAPAAGAPADPNLNAAPTVV